MLRTFFGWLLRWEKIHRVGEGRKGKTEVEG